MPDMDFDDRTLITTVGDCVSRGGNVFWRRGWREQDSGQYARLERVFSSLRGAALYRRMAFDTVGAFSTRISSRTSRMSTGGFALSSRAECWYVPSAVAFHVGGATVRRSSGWAALFVRGMRIGWYLRTSHFEMAVLLGP